MNFIDAMQQVGLGKTVRPINISYIFYVRMTPGNMLATRIYDDGSTTPFIPTPMDVISEWEVVDDEATALVDKEVYNADRLSYNVINKSFPGIVNKEVFA